MLFSSSSSLSSGPSHSILLLLSVWAFQSKRERKKILRLFLNYSIKCSDGSDSLTWSVWLIRHTPFQFHFISGGSTALETAEKRGRVRWRRASCCRPWRHLLALSIKTTKWASRERERRDFGAIFVCYLRKKKNFSKEMVQQLSKSGPKESPLLKAGHPPAGKTRSHASTRVILCVFWLHEAKAVLFSTDRPRYSSVHTDTPLHLTSFFFLFSNPVVMHTLLVSREMPSLLDFVWGLHHCERLQPWFPPTCFCVVFFLFFFFLCFPAGPSARSHTVFPLAGSSL